MAHRTLKDIAALYRFGLPEGRLNGKGREASLSIASSQSPAVPPGNGSTSRVRDPSSSAYEPDRVWIKVTQRPLDTRKHRVNKIERGGGTVAHGHHNTPDPQATMAMSSVG